MKKTYLPPTTDLVAFAARPHMLTGSVIHETTNPIVGDGEDYTRRMNFEWDPPTIDSDD